MVKKSAKGGVPKQSMVEGFKEQISLEHQMKQLQSHG